MELPPASNRPPAVAPRRRASPPAVQLTGFIGFELRQRFCYRFGEFALGALSLVVVAMRGFQQKQHVADGYDIDHYHLMSALSSLRGTVYSTGYSLGET